MTLEDAIKHSEEVAEEHTRYNRYGGFESWTECAKEHRQLANWLKELKQLREQEPCEDARSLAQVFEILGNLMSIPYDLDRPINKDDVSESMDAIRALPTVTPTRKKGHWIMTNNYLTAAYETIDYVKCSCCGEESLEEGDYCPNCGADMRREDE